MLVEASGTQEDGSHTDDLRVLGEVVAAMVTEVLDAEFMAWKQRYDELMSGWAYLRPSVTAGFEAQHVSGPDDDAPGDRWGRVASEALSGETFEKSEGETVEPFTGPVLFLAGACNTWIGANLQARHAQRYARAQLEVVADAGHEMFWENPEQTFTVVRAFLDTVRPGLQAVAPRRQTS